MAFFYGLSRIYINSRILIKNILIMEVYDELREII
jgi:hypothetical protein